MLTSTTLAIMWIISGTSYSKGMCSGSIMDKAGCSPRQGRFVASKSFKHDRTSYTQGLVWHEGALYESAGQIGQCRISKTSQGAKSQGLQKQWEFRHKKQRDVFCEGLTYHPPSKLWYQLTWKKQLAYVLKLEKSGFQMVDTIKYEGEGWGIESCAGSLFMTDGSSNLYRISPKTFKKLETIPVTVAGQPLRYLNEMTCIDNGLLSNVYYSNSIFRIELGSGIVSAAYEVEIDKLLSQEERKKLKPDEVLNGLAWAPLSGQLYLTGKNWPKIFSGKLQLN